MWTTFDNWLFYHVDWALLLLVILLILAVIGGLLFALSQRLGSTSVWQQSEQHFSEEHFGGDMSGSPPSTQSDDRYPGTAERSHQTTK